MKVWTSKEANDLIKLYNKLNNDELMEYFGRTYLSIYKKARRLNLCKTKEMKFENSSRCRSGDKAANWKGGRTYTKHGYVLVLDKGNPKSDKSGYIFEHRKIMSEKVGRDLDDEEVVHHINGIKDDNRIENLELMTKGEHIALHHTGSKRSKETKDKISEIAKERFKDKENHPMYKDVPINKMVEMVNQGMTVKSVCSKFDISKRTYYNKLEEIKWI